MLIDCDTCRAPTGACNDCVMTVLLQATVAPVELDDTERDVLSSLASVGLVPPLRLVVGVASGFDTDDSTVGGDRNRAERPNSGGGVRGIA